jgi:hypothetical protein
MVAFFTIDFLCEKCQNLTTMIGTNTTMTYTSGRRLFENASFIKPPPKVDFE